MDALASWLVRPDLAVIKMTHYKNNTISFISLNSVRMVTLVVVIKDTFIAAMATGYGSTRQLHTCTLLRFCNRAEMAKACWRYFSFGWIHESCVCVFYRQKDCVLPTCLILTLSEISRTGILDQLPVPPKWVDENLDQGVGMYFCYIYRVTFYWSPQKSVQDGKIPTKKRESQS